MSRLFSELSHPIGVNFAYNLPIITSMTELLKRDTFTNLGLVCTGSSGAIIATVIATQLPEKPKIIYLHKRGEEGHSHYNRDNVISVQDIVVVDDFISSGRTINYIIEQLHDLGVHQVKGLCLSGDFGLEYIKEPTFFENYYCLT